MRISHALMFMCSAALATSGSAWAADEVGSTSGGLQEVVVTAEKKTEDVQRAPIAIDTASAGQLAALGIKDEQDLQSAIPSVRFGEGPSLFTTIRGIGTQSTTVGVDLAVAHAIDGVYTSHSAAVPLVMYDMNRVEVALGPQGTLVGRNANAGVVNLITNNPSDHFEGNGSVQLGNYSTVGFEGMINIPLSSTVQLRVAGASQKHSAYDDFGANDEHFSGGRMKLAITPTDDLKVLLALEVDSAHARAPMYSYCPPHTTTPGCAGVAWRPYGSDQGSNPNSYDDNHIFGASAQVDYSMSFADLTSITGLRTYNQRSSYLHRNFGSGVPGEGFGLDDFTTDTFFTQEIRLASKPAAPFSWVGGVYFSNEVQPDIDNYRFTFLQPPITFGYDTQESHYTSKAVFGDVTYPIYDTVRLRAGLRYTDEDKRAFGTGYVYGGTNAIGTPLSATPFGDEEVLARWTWKGGLDWDITPTTLFYITGSNGFKSGGVNRVPAGQGLPTTYAPEFITAEELGLKNRFFNGTLQVNLSAYHYDYSGYQITAALNSNAGGLFFSTLSSQTATLRGAELSTQWLATDNDLITFSATTESTNFTEFELPSAGIHYTGNHMPLAPIYTLAASVQHTFQLPQDADLRVRLDTLLTGAYFTDASNDPGSYQNSYTHSGASVTYDRPGSGWNSGWSISAYCRNLENYGALNVWYAAVPGEPARDIAGVDPPRTFGVNFKMSFR